MRLTYRPTHTPRSADAPPRSTFARRGALAAAFTIALSAVGGCGDDAGSVVDVRIDATDVGPDVADTVVASDTSTPEDTTEPEDTSQPEVIVPNEPPTLTAPGDAIVSAGALYVAQLTATDPNLPDDLLVFTIDEAPLGLSLDRGDGRIVWAPRADELGAHTLAFTVTDADGLSDTASFTVSVVVPGQPPTIAPIADQRVVLGDTLELPLTIGDPDLPDDTLTTTLVLAPATLSLHLDDEPPTLTWTPQPSDLGAHDVVIEVTDADGRVATEHFIARAVPVNGAPVAHDDLFVTPRGVTTTLTPLANDDDPDGDPLTATVLTAPTRGTLTDRGDGTFGYRPGTPAEVPFEVAKAYKGDNITGGTIRTFGAIAIGDLEGDATTEIVAVAQRNAGINNVGWVTAMRAAPPAVDLQVLWGNHTWATAQDATTGFDSITYSVGPVLADLDGDGPLEVLLNSQCTDHLVVLEHTGDTRFSTAPGDCTRTDRARLLTVADLERDGRPRSSSSPMRRAPASSPTCARSTGRAR